MLPMKKRVGKNGRIVIGRLLKIAKIKPGDWVEITHDKNKITIKRMKRVKPKGVVRAAAGILKEHDNLVDEMLRIREEEDDRPRTSI